MHTFSTYTNLFDIKTLNKLRLTLASEELQYGKRIVHSACAQFANCTGINQAVIVSFSVCNS